MELREVYNIAEEYNVDVDYFPMRDLVALALHITNSVAVDYNKIETTAEEKVIVLHEILHCIFGQFCNVYSSLFLRSKYECRVLRELIKLLLPWKDIKKAIKKEGLHNDWELAEYFNVPVEFMRKALEFYKNVKPML